MLGDEHRPEEPHHANLLKRFDGGLGKRCCFNAVASTADDVVDLADFVEDGFDVVIDGLAVAKVAGISGKARFSGWVGLQEARDGRVDSLLL